MAGLLTSRVITLLSPSRIAPVAVDKKLFAYSCGNSARILLASLLGPLAGTIFNSYVVEKIK